MQLSKPSIYVVATPIGNLSDISQRALAVLQSVDVVAAEDTRTAKKLLTFFGIQKPVIAYHDHNELETASRLLDSLRQKTQALALISDAGTPLISDPGYHLVRLARSQAVSVIPIPGPCALVAALSVSGLPVHHFVFEGFLPAKPTAKQARLQMLSEETRTLVFYESCHRIVATMDALIKLLGKTRRATIARELTKLHETTYTGTLEELGEQLGLDPHMQKGEMVIVVEGKPEAPQTTTLGKQEQHVMQVLLKELTLKQAVALGRAIFEDTPKKILYDYALSVKKAVDG